MVWIIVVIIAVMLLYSWVASEAEHRGDHYGERSAQDTISLGWIILGAFIVFWLVRSC